MSHYLETHNTTRTQPTTEPVDVDEVKADLRINYPDHDRLIERKITVARQYLEEQTLWQALLTQTCIDYFDRLAGELALHWAPVQSITSIAYLDTAGASQTLASSVYELANRDGLAIVRLKYGQSWPSVRGHADAVTLTYVAGYGDDAADVPQSIRDAVRILAAHMFLHPEGDAPMPMAVESLLAGQSSARVLGL